MNKKLVVEDGAKLENKHKNGLVAAEFETKAATEAKPVFKASGSQ